ncbi:U11/U12 small nuclear ribonucleoprotein 65 kDa protein-like isoform X1 [Teleopsis dalmanni]|uniref:U11/U12 small nuclear ribonucleoprotein 65 kDa protein-like isoform X1 n=1 Tax=Teleopsis dalmanni TaxID=139649 RepID=UPI0018CD5549|nr:U11/U12 small nuclear ribonucleoprotein 65 kDa protein-like isoform X1 [Teleopsis dalmanni]
MQNKENKTAYILLIKNVPKRLQILEDFLQKLNLPAQQNIKAFGRKRALITYATETDAAKAFDILQNQQLLNKKLCVSNFIEGGIKQLQKSKSTQTNENGSESEPDMPKISKYVQKLYACNANLNFNQPPPPYLKYAYPKITPDIMDSICIALMSNVTFYTQVLHLMNRMNLEPPFGPRIGKFQPIQPPKVASTQTETEHIMPTETITKSASESELESSEDEQKRMKRTEVPIKRKVSDSKELYQKKARLILKATQHTQSVIPVNMNETPKPSTLATVFEKPQKLKPQQIALNLKPKPQNVAPIVPPALLTTQQLTTEQLQELPIYKNYQIGTPSQKLYIKNLAKEVSEEDLILLYERFVPTREHLEVKVMQQGRMKGQAFVTFINMPSDDVEAIVANALKDTNGFLLRDKPMIVCFGKQ